MATGAMYTAKHNDCHYIHPQRPNPQVLKALYATKKRAHRSKPPRGITIKKPCPGDDIHFQDLMNSAESCLQEKRKLDALEASVSPVDIKKRQVLQQNGDTDSYESDQGKAEEDFGWLGISGCESVKRFVHLDKGYRSGSFGLVSQAWDSRTGEIVALKALNNGLSPKVRREVEVLKCLNGHPSIVGFRQVVVDEDNHDTIYIVMEFVDNDLWRYMRDMRRPFCLYEVKFLMRQLLEGVKFMHGKGLLHRDLKPSNILIGENKELKICDFGLSRHSGNGPCTPKLGTRGYIAPEILLGAENYSSAVDMWAVGCVMAEMFLKKPIFSGRSEVMQLNEIFQVLGTPDGTVWPAFPWLCGSKLAKLVNQPHNTLGSMFADCDPVMTVVGLDLLNKFLTFDPSKRITAEDALKHGWFTQVPLPNEKAMD